MDSGQQIDLGSRRAGAYLAADLSMWVARETLMNLVLSVVQTVEEHRLRPAVARSTDGALPPRMMLALLTCCYATGVYGSQVITDKICEDPALQYFCADRRPTAAEIRRFRNRNRELIAQALEVVCLVIWKIRFGAWRAGEPGSTSRLFGGSHRFDPLIQVEIRCEVMERLYRAEVEDSCCLNQRVVAA
jgi:hypothetical protein